MTKRANKNLHAMIRSSLVSCNTSTVPGKPLSLDAFMSAARVLGESDYFQWEMSGYSIPVMPVPLAMPEPEPQYTYASQFMADIYKAKKEWEAEMTKYFDKHGTEVREGDEIQELHSGWRGKVSSEDVGIGSIVNFSGYIVLSRADGSPVYRYSGGEDVRVGDEFRHCEGTEMWVSSLDVPVQCVESAKAAWARNTLLRRAAPLVDDSKKRPGKTLQDYVDALDAKYREQATQQERPVLGKDRNGSEVRRGEKLRLRLSDCVFEVTFGNNRTVTGCITSNAPNGLCVGDSINEYWEYTELVTDEKEEPVANMRELLCEIPGCGRPRMTGEGQCRWCKAALDRAQEYGTTLESLARALSQPTRAERIAANYAKFHAAVAREVAREPSFAVVTDKSDTELMAFIKAPLVGERRCACMSDRVFNYEELAFRWVAEMRALVDAEAGKNARARK